MEDSKEISCRLCINSLKIENFTVIDASIQEILRTVSLNLDFDNNYKDVMCSTCSVKLYSAFDFKSTCLYVEDKILSHINPKVSFIDLREVYLKDHENEASIKMENDQKICRLCLQLVMEGFVLLNDMMLEMIHRYIPEVNFGITEDPVVCRQCFGSLGIHDTFIRTCVNVQPKIYAAGDKIMDFQPQNTFIKIENDDEQKMDQSVEIEKELKADKILINTEEVVIKSEGNGWQSDYNLHNETIENKMGHKFEDIGEIKNEYMLNCEPGEVQASNLEEVPPYDSGYENALNSDHMGTSELIYCEEASTLDQLNEEPSKDNLEIQMWKCDTCSYETKRKNHLKVHQLSHKDPSEIQMHKCGLCAFETKYKHCLKYHQLTHKDPSEIHMYKCHICTFETKHRHRLRRHQLTHKDRSEIEMYKCDTCDFETKYKGQIKVHQLLHKDSSEIQMYKCSTCTYEAKSERYLKDHQLTHKDPSEVRMYKCDTCSFQTKRKSHLKTHQLIHKDTSELQMYKCNTCTYETKYKGTLKSHQLIHKDPSEIQMYKCDICSFETRYKKGFSNHQLTHGCPTTSQKSECDPSVHNRSLDIPIYKCNDCVYETRHKDNLRVHVLRHQDPSKVPMYKCDKCVFQTKHKRSITRHELTHKNSVVA